MKTPWNPKDSKAFLEMCIRDRILSGSYTGDDARSRDISLGVSPRAVFVVRQDGAMQSDMYTYGGLALQGAPVTMRDRCV